MTWAIEEKSYSQRRACSLIGLDPKTYRYASRRSDDARIRERLKTLAGQRRRFGYRRLHILLRRDGIVLTHKKLFRLYREERLTVRRRGGRKRALGTWAPMAMPQGPNQRWSLDFVADQLVDGRRFRVLVVVDDFTRVTAAGVLKQPHVEATRLLGFGTGYILRKLVLPEIAPILITLSAFARSTAIIAISTLSAISVGLRPPTPEFGAMIVELLPYYAEAPLHVLMPGVLIFLLVLGLQLATRSEIQ